MDDRIRSTALAERLRPQVDRLERTGQALGLPPPPLQKPFPPAQDDRPPGAGPFDAVCRAGLLEVLRRRRRSGASPTRPLPRGAGVPALGHPGRRETGRRRFDAADGPVRRARHAFETYLYCRKVGTLAEGIYRYLPLSHALLFEFAEEGLAARIADACLGQRFVGQGAPRSSGASSRAGWNGATAPPRTASSPWTRDTSARTSTCARERSAPGRARSRRTTRRPSTTSCALTGRRSSSYTWPGRQKNRVP